MKNTRLLFVALALCTKTAHAQNCLGHRALSNAPVNASLNYRFLQGSTGPETRMLFGKQQFYGGFNIGLMNTGSAHRAFDIGAQFGSSVQVGSALSVCPIASVNHQTSVYQNAGYPGTTEVLLGGSAGMQKTVSSRVTLIPYVGAGYLRATLKEVYDPVTDVTTSQLTHTGAEIFGGVGVQFSRRFLAHAALRYRDGYGDLSKMFTVGVTVAPTRKIRSK